MDKETADIKRQIQLVGELVGHEGWEIVSKALMRSIEDNESLSDITITTPEQVFLDIKSRQIAKKIIGGWLEDIMGTAQLANEQLHETKGSYIITRED